VVENKTKRGGGSHPGVNRARVRGEMIIKIQRELKFMSGRWGAILRLALPAEEGLVVEPLRNVKYSIFRQSLTSQWGFATPSLAEGTFEALGVEKDSWRADYERREFDSREEAVEWLYSETAKIKETLKKVVEDYKVAKMQELEETEEYEIE